MNKFKILATMIILLVAALSSCQNMCTEMGCGGSFEITVSSADGALETGVYTVVLVDPDDGTVIATGEIGTEDPDAATTDNYDMYLSINPGGRLIITFMPAWGDTPPSAITVSVTTDTVTYQDQTVVPDWEEDYPNGEDCDEYPCYQAPGQDITIVP